jgi:hypothetical protein
MRCRTWATERDHRLEAAQEATSARSHAQAVELLLTENRGRESSGQFRLSRTRVSPHLVGSPVQVPKQAGPAQVPAASVSGSSCRRCTPGPGGASSTSGSRPQGDTCPHCATIPAWSRPRCPDQQGRPIPTYPCPRCGLQVASRFNGFRVKNLKHVGWQLFPAETYVHWCGHGQEVIPVPRADGLVETPLQEADCPQRSRYTS